MPAWGCLWAVPLPSGSPRRVGDLVVDENSARLSADSKRLVYARGSDLWIANADGTDSSRLFSAPAARLISPAFSPDGTRVRFTVLNPQDNTSSLWEIGVDKSNPHALLPGWHNPPRECCGSWTPGRGLLRVFQSSADSTTSGDIFCHTRHPPFYSQIILQPDSVDLRSSVVCYGIRQLPMANISLWEAITRKAKSSATTRPANRSCPTWEGSPPPMSPSLKMASRSPTSTLLMTRSGWAKQMVLKKFN